MCFTLGYLNSFPLCLNFSPVDHIILKHVLKLRIPYEISSLRGGFYFFVKLLEQSILPRFIQTEARTMLP